MKIAFTLLFALVAHLTLAQISITRPIQNSVLQRNAINSLSVGIAGQIYSSTNLTPTMQYRIQKLSAQNSVYQSTPINWTTYSCSNGGLFEFTVTLAGGWYQLDIQSTTTGSQVASVKFGVGEVFLIAGQSNAQGVAGNIFSTTPYDGVIADLHLDNTGCISQFPLYPSFNKLITSSPIAPQGPNNWCYTVMGNSIVSNLGIPVAFFNAAQQNTGVRNWIESINTPTGYTSSTYGPGVCPGGGPGHPYIALKKTMMFYGSLFGTRSVLWHQGENDAHDVNGGQTTGTDYINRLRTLISQARTDFGHSDLSWWISKVSRTDPTSQTVYATNATIISAQGTVQADSYNKVGPSTDGIGPRNATDNIHFTGTGLRDLGNAWYTSISGTTLTSATPVTPNSILHVSLTGTIASGFTLQANSGFAQYFWISPTQTMLNPNAPTSQNISNPTGGNQFICYAKHSNGQWYISQVVKIPTSGPGVRLAAVDDQIESDEYPELAYNIYPSPATDQTSISFKLDGPKQVNLSIVDVSGKVIKQLANGPHAEGSYSYPLDLSSFQPGIYISNLTANDLHLAKKILRIAK